MYIAAKDLSEEFCDYPAPAFMHSASLSYSFNRQLSDGRGWTPMPDNMTPYLESADTVIAKSDLDSESPVAVEITHSWNSSTEIATGTITATFDQSVPSGDYRVGLFIVENHIQGDGTNGNYWQSSDFQIFVDGEMMDKDYIFPDVMRDEVIAGSIWGDTLTTDATIEVGKAYTMDFSYELPELYYDLAPVAENIKLIPFVCRYDGLVQSSLGTMDPTGEILNANLAMMVDDAVSRETFNVENRSFDVISTVSGGNLNITLPESGVYDIELMNSRGQIIKSLTFQSSGLQEQISLDGIASGVLFLNITGVNGIVSQKLIAGM